MCFRNRGLTAGYTYQKYQQPDILPYPMLS